MTEQVKQNSGLNTVVKACIGGLIVWKILKSEEKDSVRRFFYQVGSGLEEYNRKLAEQERQKRLQETVNHLLIPKIEQETALLVPSTVTAPKILDNFTKQLPEPDADWRKRIIHPSVVLLLGKRGSGKSALGYRLLELLRGVAKPYVVGAPSAAASLLPDWVGIAPTLDELPPKSVALVDEAYLLYHSRGSMAAASKAMSQALNLSRQREQTLIFVSQEARQVDKNIASSTNIIIFKDLGMLQLEFDRRELNGLATQAREAFASINGDKRKSSFVYAPDVDFAGVMTNELPSFWKPALSRIFASESASAPPRAAKNTTSKEKAEKAKALRGQGASYADIARILGVSRATVLNYIKAYPYRKKE